MKVSVLASGSKGNSTFVETGSSKFLIDIGMSTAYIEKNLKEIGVDPCDIKYIFITHTHSDHIYGLKTFVKKYNPIICFTEKMHNDLDFNIDNYIYLDKQFESDDFKVTVIKTSHDASDSNGYVIESSGKSFVYITDTGYINVRNHKYLKNKNLYVLESNHDVKLLREGKYPYYLQQRILSDSGHLSNDLCSKYLQKFVGDDTRAVVLAHLSEHNNTPEKALETLFSALDDEFIKKCHIEVAKPKERIETINL